MGYLGGVLQTSALRAGAGVLTSALRTVGTLILDAGKWLVVTLVGLLAALIAGFRVAVVETQKLAKEIQDISNRTGMSFSQSMNSKFGFGALGVNANEVFGSQGNMPMFLRMRAAAFGYADPSNPGNMAQNAMRFQQQAAGGPFNRLMAMNQLRGIYGGEVPAGMLSLMNMSPDKIQEQQAWQTRMQSSMGLDPAKIQKYAQELPLIQMRIGSIVELIKVKLAGEGMPAVERLLTVVANFLGKNARGIADFLINAMRFLWVNLPDLLLKGANGAVTAIGFIIKVLFNLGDTAVNILAALEQSNSGLNSWIVSVLKTFDVFINAGINLANVVQNIGTIFHNISAFIYNTFNWVGGKLAATSKWLGGTWGAGYDFSDRMEYSSWKPLNLTSNLAGYYQETVQPALQDAQYSEKLRGFLDANRGGADDIIKNMRGHLEEISKGLGTKDDRARDFDRVVEATKENTDAVRGVRDAIVGHGKDLLSNFSAQDMIARIAAMIAEDNWLVISRA